MRNPSISLSAYRLSGVLFAATLAASCGNTETLESPVRDIPGILLLDTGDDGNNTPLEDDEAPAGFSSYGFWYTYDDIGSCMYDKGDVVNPDTEAELVPAQGSTLTTTPYASLGIQPPPESLPNAADNTHGIRYSGGGQEYFGAGLGFKLENAYAASNNQGIDFTVKYAGFRFWAYSSLESNYIFKLQDLYSTPEAGQCIPGGPAPTCMGPQNCEITPMITFSLAPNTWTYVEAYFKTPPSVVSEGAAQVHGPLARPNWGGVDITGRDIKDLPPEPAHIFQLQFQTSTAPGATGQFDLIVDNFGFIEAGSTADKTAGVP